MDNQNYLMLNGVKIELTPEQLEQLKSGIKPQVDFSDYNETDWFYYKFNSNNEWLSKNAFGDSTSFCLSYDYHRKNNPSGLGRKEHVIEFRRPTKEEMEILYKHHPEYKPKIKWEDFGKISGYIVKPFSLITQYSDEKSSDLRKDVFPTKEEAEACLALSQLLQWRDKYNEGWKPDWSKDDMKHTIVFDSNSCIISASWYISHVLSFKTQTIRDKFLEDFRDLIEIARPLL